MPDPLLLLREHHHKRHDNELNKRGKQGSHGGCDGKAWDTQLAPKSGQARPTQAQAEGQSPLAKNSHVFYLFDLIFLLFFAAQGPCTTSDRRVEANTMELRRPYNPIEADGKSIPLALSPIESRFRAALTPHSRSLGQTCCTFPIPLAL